MFAIERLRKIEELLFENKRVDVVELSELFSVTEVTIRRDLDKLEKSGVLTKTYGGGLLNKDYMDEPVSASFGGEASDDARMIGKIAAQMVENGDAIFLSSGSIGQEIARHLEDKRLTVVTNDLLVALELKDQIGIKVILTGGDLLQSSTTLVGGFTLQTLNGIFINKSFIEAKGIHFQAGYMVDSHEEVMVIEHVKRISSEIIVVAEHNKFNQTAFAKFGDLASVKKVITNKDIPNEYKTYFYEQAVKLFTTFSFE